MCAYETGNSCGIRFKEAIDHKHFRFTFYHESPAIYKVRRSATYLAKTCEKAVHSCLNLDLLTNRPPSAAYAH